MTMKTTGLEPPVELDVTQRGADVLRDPLVNQDASFSAEMRDQLHLGGLLPARVIDLETQARRAHASIAVKENDLEKYIGLMALQDRNEVLFYRVLLDQIERYLPLVYTPTVGLATQQFSQILRRPRGLWIGLEHRGRIAEVLERAPQKDVRLIVVTDGERILGLGDLGAGGMAISIGKLSLYTLGAGIHPSKTLPICLDVGTDNPDLLASEQYLGHPEPRCRGARYDEFVEEFVEAVAKVFPGALLQWEDFKKVNAMSLLERYRHRILSFNDDIQGTAAVGLAGVLAGVRATGGQIEDQTMVILGAGAAGVGIAEQLKMALERAGLSPQVARTRLALLDSRGLLVEGREYSERDDYKRVISLPADFAQSKGLTLGEGNDLEAVIRALGPSVLIGTSGQPGAFSEAAVRAMAQRTEEPLIFPFSNPTASSEAKPEDIFEWTDARAWVATGSPFPPVETLRGTRFVGQGNNVYIFPGVGLGALVAKATEVTDSMFTVAAETLSASVTPEEVTEGRLYPRLGRLREISYQVAKAVALEAQASGVAPEARDLEEQLRAAMWSPAYPQLRPVE